MSQIFYINEEAAIVIKILILSHIEMNVFYAQSYNDIVFKEYTMPSIKILIKTLYIIKDKYIYEKYIYNNHNENIFLCITEEKTRKICYEDIQQILTKIYKQYELLNIKKQLQTSTYSINTIYKYLLNISEEKITQKQLKKSFIICLLNNEINPYALFNINLQNKNDQSFEEKMRKYIKYYGKEKVQQQYLVILMCKQILNLPN